MIQHYLRLELEPGANQEEIKDAFRRLAKRYHPDAGRGNAHLFARVKEAYDTLSNEEKRAQFERIYQASNHHQNIWVNLVRRVDALRAKYSPQTDKKQATQTRTARQNRSTPPLSTMADRLARMRKKTTEKTQEPVVTRVMSIALPRSGKLVLEGIPAQWIIEPTLPETLWDTTLAKFGKDENERLSQHIIQLRVTGRRSLARRVELQATEYGVRAGLIPMGENPASHATIETNPFVNPLTIRATVPPGTNLHLLDLGGTIALGDLEGFIRARLSGRTTLRSGRIQGASLTLREKSRAILSWVEGDLDALLTGQAKMLLNGDINQLRAVVEKSAQLDVLAPIRKFLAEVNGRAFVHTKGSIGLAQCSAADNGVIQIEELRASIVSNTTGQARIEVKKKPSFVPIRNATTHRRNA